MPRIPCVCRAGWLTPASKVSPALQVLAFDPKHKAPLVVSGSRGQGRFIYSAIPLEPQEGMVFQYLPFLAQAIVDELHVAPSLAADNLCVYVDAGGEPKVDPAVVVAQLKSWSVREVHLGAFYGSETFRGVCPAFHRRRPSGRDRGVRVAGISHGQPGVLGPAPAMARSDGQRASGHHGLALSHGAGRSCLLSGRGRTHPAPGAGLRLGRSGFCRIVF